MKLVIAALDRLVIDLNDRYLRVWIESTITVANKAVVSLNVREVGILIDELQIWYDKQTLPSRWQKED